MTSSETRLHSGEGTEGLEMVCDLFVHLASEDFRKAGQDRNRSVAVWVKSVTPFEEADDRSCFPIFGKLRRHERLNRLVIGVATNSADNFRKKGSRLASPADL